MISKNKNLKHNYQAYQKQKRLFIKVHYKTKKNIQHYQQKNQMKNITNPSTVLQQLLTSTNLTLLKLFSSLNRCPILRDDAQLLQGIFTQKPEIIEQAIDWMFDPESRLSGSTIFLNADKSNKDDIKLGHKNSPEQKIQRQIPHLCKRWIHDNQAFYHQMCLAHLNKTINIERWFRFLFREKPHNQAIFATSMGYFCETMIPFLNYIDLDVISYRMSSIIEDSIADSGQFRKSFTEEKAKITRSSQISKKSQFPPVLYGLFSKEFLLKLIMKSHNHGVFKFIYILCLRCIEEQESEKSGALQVLIKLFAHSETFLTKLAENTFNQNKATSLLLVTVSEWLENMVSLLKELTINIDSDADKVQIFIEAIDDSNLPKILIDLILRSNFYTTEILEIVRFHSDQKFMASSVLERDQTTLSRLENNLTYSVNNGNGSSAKQVPIRQEKVMIQLCLEVLMNLLKISRDLGSGLKNKNTIEVIFSNLPNLLKIVSVPQNFHVPFSSGENIKPITMLKHNFFKLFLQCLSIHCNESSKEPNKLNKIFQIHIQRQQVSSMIQRYLNENRWNNITHKTLQKIVYAINSPACLLPRQETANNQFLAFLIENFINKDYVFLKTLHFTHQGNLHSLYQIAKDVSKYLNANRKLLVTLKNFEPWKKFLMNNLKSYESNLYKDSVPLEKGLLEAANKNGSENFKVSIDEVDSIKKLLEQVEEQLSWQRKLQRKRMSLLKSCIPGRKRSQGIVRKKFSQIDLPVNALQISQCSWEDQKLDDQSWKSNIANVSRTRLFQESIDLEGSKGMGKGIIRLENMGRVAESLIVTTSSAIQHSSPFANFDLQNSSKGDISKKFMVSERSNFTTEKKRNTDKQFLQQNAMTKSRGVQLTQKGKATFFSGIQIQKK